jgi:tRNA threonylcarbamoyladenosine biosynthesis protein TsaE
MVKFFVKELSSFSTKNPSQTKKLGEILAKEILKTVPTKKAFIIGLTGELGGGKTTFLQGFAKGLGIKEKILSPTFVIMKKFKIRGNSCLNLCKFVYFYHLDCYRIKKPKEILDLDFKKIILNPQNIIAIEWAEKIKKILPKNTFIFKFKFINKTKREIVLESNNG